MTMQAGILGVVHGASDSLDSRTFSASQEGVELQRCIDIEDQLQLDGGQEIVTGTVAREILNKREEPKINDGAVFVESTRDISTEMARFVIMPDDFVLLEPGSGSFAFDLIGREVEALVERAEIDLDAFVSDRPYADYWKYGFYNSGLNAENGVFYGFDVQEDKVVQDLLESSSANQIGVDYVYNDTPMKVTMSESGYLEVYKPNDWETAELADYILSDLSPYIGSP